MCCFVCIDVVVEGAFEGGYVDDVDDDVADVGDDPFVVVVDGVDDIVCCG